MQIRLGARLSFFRRMAVAALLVVLLPACGGTADSSVAPAKLSTPASNADMEVPEEGGVVALVGQTTFDFPGDGDDALISVADSILDGFQAVPNYLTWVDGGAIRTQSPIDAKNKPALSKN